jgi:hypothetical protein
MVGEAQRLLPGRITPDRKIVMSFHSFVLKTGRYTIMVDTCCGNDKPRPGREQFNIGKLDYLGQLTALGVKPEEVTHVMCTHLHWDHVGWNTRLLNGQWVPTFPNARYIMAKREYDYWDGVYQKEKDKRDNMHVLGFEDSVLPIMRAEKAVLVADDYELDKGISISRATAIRRATSSSTSFQAAPRASSSATSSIIRCSFSSPTSPAAPTTTWMPRASRARR